ncbi:MAG: Imm52 family immunity protein, partial [Sneathiella sp.]
MDTYLAGAYWGPRKETVWECAERTSAFFKKLALLSDDLAHWRLRDRSKKQKAGSSIMDPNAMGQITEQIKSGTNRKDMGDKEVIPELGFRLGLWNGKSSTQEMLSLGIQCGAYSGTGMFSNTANISPLLSFDVSNEDTVRKFSEAFIDAWEPDFFVLTRKSRLNEAAAMAREQRNQWEPFLDYAL